ncbi:rab9 effector protein with kelch motifs-like [Sycon ciliatum]|uniref:rab9 effector protein with kelch motifs-like n=1 Tax=Sycon ciliatum TaxID=27933 RepID=UPI0031F6CF3D
MAGRSPNSKWLAAAVDGDGVSPSFGLAACLASDGFVYCFGGTSNEDEAPYFEGLFRFQATAGDNTIHWESVKTTGYTAPQGREGHGLMSVGRRLYLLGGTTADEDGKFCDKVFAFNIDDLSWDEVSVSGTSPTCTSPSYCNIGEKVFVFGGVFDGTATNSVYMLDTVGLKWTLLECAGTSPAPRCDHAACAAGDGVSLYVYGGCGGEDLIFSDVHQLDTSTLTWSQVDASGSTASPGARDYCTMVPCGKEGLVVFGGSRDEKAVAETYYLDLTKKPREWKMVEAEGDSPVARFSHATVMCGNMMVVIGGTCSTDDGETDKDVNDVCLLHFPDLKIDQNASFEPTTLPVNHYTNPPQPARRRAIPAPKLVTARDFEETKQNIVKSIAESFDQMVDSYLKLDQEKETLRLERAGLEEDRRQLEKMQKEHEELFEKQRTSNEEWLEDRRAENDKERQAIANEKATLAKEKQHLEQERETFDQKNKKLEGIMNQFKGIG